MALEILPPDINQSDVNFSVVNGKLLFGLHGIKNVGMAAIESIVSERTAKGPFTDLFDLCKRVDLRTANKRVLENLICAGALDTLPGNRAQQFAEVEAVIDHAVAYKKDKATGQMGLFDMGANNATGTDETYVLAPRAEWPEREKLEKEKEVVGFYVSAHPLETYRKQIKLLGILPFTQTLTLAMNHKGEQEFVGIGCGLLRSKKRLLPKKVTVWLLYN